jgi:hypothetical protein
VTRGKALVAALTVVVAGALGGFVGYALGRNDTGSPTVTNVISVAQAKHVYTLKQGDVVLEPATATRCEASGEGGFPNLFCSRIGSRGRFQVVFWNDSVDLYDLARHGEPMVPTYSVPATLKK